MRHQGTLVCLSLAAILATQACGTDERKKAKVSPLTASASSGVGSTGVGGAGGEGGSLSVGTGFATGCDPACAAGQFCSATGVCIDEGTCVAPEDCGENLTCDTSTKKCVPGGACGKFEVKAQTIQPNLFVVLDRSCSMQTPVNGQSRWKVAVGALINLMTIHKGKFRFGLTGFPDLDMNACEQTAVPFPPAADQENAIGSMLFNSLNFADPVFPKGPICTTNIDTAIKQAKDEPKLYDPDRTNYVMLVTDGAQSPTCNAAGGDAGTEQMVKDMLAAGIKTFVIGFAGGQGLDIAALNSFADAGGTPLPDPNIRYYDAADGAALDKALTDIAVLALSCSYSLDKAPEDPSKLSVFLQNDPAKIPQDKTHTTGWDYDPATNSVTFYGATCDLIKSGTITDVDVVYGCDVPTPD